MLSRLTSVIAVVVCLVVFSSIGCGRREEEQTGQQQSKPQAKAPTESSSTSQSNVSEMPAQPAMPTQEQLAAKAEQTQQALAKMNEGKVVEPVDFRKLKELLPDSVQGIERSDSSGGRTKVMGIDITRAEAKYQGQGDAVEYLSITIMDMGNVSGPMRMGLAAWAMAEFERETDTGYERTTTYKGHKAMEEFDKQAKQGTFHVHVADRFIVEVDGINVSMDIIKKALDQIDLNKLVSYTSD
jgi:hypothetical protein